MIIAESKIQISDGFIRAVYDEKEKKLAIINAQREGIKSVSGYEKSKDALDSLEELRKAQLEVLLQYRAIEVFIRGDELNEQFEKFRPS